MTQVEMQSLLRRYRILAILVGAMLQDPLEQEKHWFQLGQICGLPIREFLAYADPEEDPSLYLAAIQTWEALRKEQVLVRQLQAGRPVDLQMRWN